MWGAKAGFYGVCTGGLFLFLAAGYAWIGPAASEGASALLVALALGVLLRCFRE